MPKPVRTLYCEKVGTRAKKGAINPIRLLSKCNLTFGLFLACFGLQAFFEFGPELLSPSLATLVADSLFRRAYTKCSTYPLLPFAAE